MDGGARHLDSGTATSSSTHSNNSVSDAEDWTKLADISSRRRIQNRIAQRNRRKNLKKGREEIEQQPAFSLTSPTNSNLDPQNNKLVWVSPHTFTTCELPKRRRENDHSTTGLRSEAPYHAHTASTPHGSPSLRREQLFSDWPVSARDPKATPFQADRSTPRSQHDFAPPEQYWYQSMMPPTGKNKPDVAYEGFGLPSPPASKAQNESRMHGEYFTSNFKEDFNELFSGQISMALTGTQAQTPKSEDSYISPAYPARMNTEKIPHVRPSTSAGKRSEDVMKAEDIPSQKTVTRDSVQPRGDGGTKSDGVDVYGYTALHLAAQKGHLSIIRLLLETGIDIDAPNGEGQSALHLAIAEGHQDVTQLLLEQGANSDMRNNEGQTTLHLAAERGDMTLVQLLLDYVSDSDCRDLLGQTAFHYAVAEGHEEVVRLMLHRGADSHAKVGAQALKKVKEIDERTPEFGSYHSHEMSTPF